MLEAGPARFVIHVSADNRFVLFVNGARVGEGPARGDLDHWRYETFDVGPLLRKGDNVLAATVWNCGALAPVAQMGDQTGFLVQGDTAAESAADTDPSWEAEAERGQGFVPINAADVPNYYAASPGEFLDGRLYDWDWQTSPAPWGPAVALGAGEPGHYAKPTPVGTGSGDNRWLLVAGPPAPDGITGRRRSAGSCGSPGCGRGRLPRHGPRPHPGRPPDRRRRDDDRLPRARRWGAGRGRRSA